MRQCVVVSNQEKQKINKGRYIYIYTELCGPFVFSLSKVLALKQRGAVVPLMLARVFQPIEVTRPVRHIHFNTRANSMQHNAT